MPSEAKEFYSNIKLDDTLKRINNEDSKDEELLKVIYKAYNVLKIIRLTKPLGTAILQSIYQTIPISTSMLNSLSL